MAELAVPINTNADPNVMAVARVRAMLRKFAITVSGSDLDLKIVTRSYDQPFGNPPAWSDGNSIGLFHDLDDSDITDVDSLIRLKGLTVHELGHVLFTPRDRTDLAKKVQSERIWTAFNILEDNRIDNMMVARLSGVAPWLLHTVLQEFFHADDADYTQLLPLIHGRHYVPQNIRDLAAQVYYNPDAVADIQRIIDEYTALNMARKPHQARALELCQELHNLLTSTDKSQHPQQYAAMPAKNGGEDMSGIREQDDALNRAEKQKQQAEQKQQSQPADSDTHSGSSSDGTSTSTPTQQLKQELNEVASKVEDEIYDDIKDMVKAMRSSSGGGRNADGDKRVRPSNHVRLEDVQPEMQIESRNFARALTELKALFDPAWVTRQSEGRLNAREFLMGTPVDEAFDMWDEGKSEVSDIECVIMLDISGSMYSMFDQAFDSMWAIKRALDSIDAKTTVITFGDYSRVLYSAESRANMQKRYSMDGYGTTCPMHGIAHARDVLQQSASAIKLFIAITDGAWTDKDESDMLIAEMRGSDILTSLVFILDSWDEEHATRMAQERPEFKLDGHGCELARVINDPSDITTFARELVQLQQSRYIHS